MNSLPQKAQKAAQGLFSDEERMKKGLMIFGGVVVVVCIGLALYFAVTYMKKVSTPDNIETIKQLQLPLFQTTMASEFKDKKTLDQAIREQGVTDRENCLINFQPLTIIHPGFLGPVSNGVYDEREGVLAALKLGARCFILPIDFYDKGTLPSTFPAPNVPCLLYRDTGDNIRSLNGGSIQKVAQTIADAAWNNSSFQKDDPFLLVLYFLRTPKENTREYLDFLSQVAKELAPLSQNLLGQTPDGSYNRQAKQNDLLFVNTQSLQKKLIVLCNVDTSGFRTAQRDFKHAYLTQEDLDYWVHMRVYKQNQETPLGATSTPDSGGIPRSIVDTLSYYVTLPEDAKTQQTAINKTKEKLMITLSPAGTNPESATLRKALDTYGVQCIPLLLVDYSPDTKALLSNWKYAWRAKPKAIRYVRPEVQIIPPQSVRANANGGALTVPT